MKLWMGFDERANEIVIIQAKRAAEPFAMQRLRLSSPLFSEGFFAEARAALKTYAERMPQIRNREAYVVLPDAAVGFEMLDIPNMSRARMAQALETELYKLGKDKLQEKSVKTYVWRQDKGSATYAAVYSDRKLAGEFWKLFSEIKILPKSVTHASNALLSGVLGMVPKLRGRSFVLADVQAHGTQIALCGRGRLQGFASVPHGASLIGADKVEHEYMQTRHESGEIAVLNARETAQAKALTQAKDAAMEGERGGVEESAWGAEPAESGRDVFLREDADGRKVYRKVPKRYPKFMMRKPPSNEEDVCYENFRILQKWIVLYARQAESDARMYAPESIVINLPSAFESVVERANEDQKRSGGLPIRRLILPERTAWAADCLWLYGCQYARHIGGRHMF